MAQPSVGIALHADSISNKLSDLAHNGDGRLYVTEQLGYIRIVEPNGTVLPRPFLDIKNKVTPTNIVNTNEQGLLGLVFSPDYATDGYFYVYYTNKTGVGNSVLARYQVSSNPDSVNPATEQILLTFTQPYPNHNGGCMKFGNDGYLYISSGDGGDANDPGERGQNLNTFLGKILRIDVSGGGITYTVPPNNPFISTTNALPELWAYGLRNPWLFSFDRLTHDMWIGDVGQNVWEEINFQPASSSGGENYGWRCYEGNHVLFTNMLCNSPISHTAPVFEYSHATTGGCSVTGGFVYRGSNYPGLYGYYFFADFCNGNIYAIDPLNGFDTTLAGSFSGKGFSTFGEDDNGELFIGDIGHGEIFRLTDATTGLGEQTAEASLLAVTPSGSSDTYSANFFLSKNNDVTLRVIDVMGKELYSSSFTLNKGRHSQRIYLPSVAQGVYTLQLLTRESSLQKKFLKN